MRRVAAAFPDSARADEALQKIHEMRDGHIFKGLAILCAPGTDPEAATKVAKDTVQRIGSKGFVGEFAKYVAWDCVLTNAPSFDSREDFVSYACLSLMSAAVWPCIVFAAEMHDDV